MTRRMLLGLAVAAVAALALLAVVRLAQQPAADAATQLAQELSCPSCAGESVAESNSAIAISMRSVIAEQLSQGRTADQIRDWFTARYGKRVLRAAPSRNPLLLWGVPLAALGISAAAATVTLRRRRTPAPDVLAGPVSPGNRRAVFITVGGGTLLVVALVGLAASRVHDDRRTAAPADLVAQQVAAGSALEDSGEYAEAADAFRRADALRPDPSVRLRLAFAQLRAGQPKAAAQTAGSVAAANPASPDALLVLGLAQHAQGDPASVQTLRRFLALAPTHPAAADVRALLTG